MPFASCHVDEVGTIAGQFAVTVSGALPPTGPGQCWLIQPTAPDQLPVPVFPIALDDGRHQFWVSAQEFAQSPTLVAIEPGSRLSLLAPVGRKWLPPTEIGHLLVAAADPGRAWPLARLALGQGWAVAWLWRFRVPDWASQVLPPAIEFHAGRPTTELVDWADLVLVDHADPAAYLKELRGLGRLRHSGHAFTCHTPPMPCGFGGCQGCWVRSRQGRVLACEDGPWIPM